MQSTPSEYHHGNLKQELIRVARDQLARGGAHSLSLRSLAREIGVSQTAPYRHFKDKNALLVALAVEGFSRLQHANERDIEQEQRDAGVQLAAAGRSYIGFARASPQLFILMFGSVIQRRNEQGELVEAANSSIEVIVEVIRRGVVQGVFVEQDPQEMAHSAWALVHGIATLAVNNICFTEQNQSLIDHTIDTLIRGFTVR